MGNQIFGGNSTAVLNLKDMGEGETDPAATDSSEMLTPSGSPLREEAEAEDCSQVSQGKRSTSATTCQEPDHHALWAVALVVFTVLNGILLGLVVKVSLDLSHLNHTSPVSPSSSPSSAALSSVASAPSSSSPPVLLEDSAFCLPCSDVYVNDIEILQDRSKVVHTPSTRKDGGRNTSLCCAPPHDDLKNLLGRMFIRVHYERDRAQGQVTLVNTTEPQDEQSVIRPHILLQLDPLQEPKEVNSTHTVPLRLKRDADDDPENVLPSSSSSSVKFQEGVVKIAQPGHFYINSDVPFVFNLALTPQTQYVFRMRSASQESLLLENSVFPCDVNTPSGCEHSFVGGVFLLQQGDEIELRVSNHSFVDRDKGVKFGVHRL